MKPLVVLASFFAAASAGIAGFGGVILGGNGGHSSNVGGSGGYTGSVGGGSSGGYTQAQTGGFSGAGIGGFGGGTGIGGFGGGGFSGGASYPSGDATSFGGGGSGQIRKFVSVHVGPEEPQFSQTKVIRAGGVPDKHVNIIFVKAPSASNQQNTEVILPEAPQQKTLVYVLVKKQESTNNVRVRGPAPTRPSKPEVCFIRYKDGAVTVPVPQGGIGGGFGVAGPAAVANVAPGAAYGPPPVVGGANTGY